MRSLAKSISDLGGQLILRSGDAKTIIERLVSETNAQAVFWNRRYGLAERDIDSSIKANLKTAGLKVKTYNGTLLTEPWEITNNSGTFFKVFSPYWRALQSQFVPAPPLSAPQSLAAFNLDTEPLDTWNLHPSSPDWSKAFSSIWQPGEQGATSRLQRFLSSSVATYKEDRNRPDLEYGTSGLSPHLAFGEISPSKIWRATQLTIQSGQVSEPNPLHFLSELAWRDFSYTLLYHTPHLAFQNYKPDFDRMPWRQDERQLQAWQKGQTGYPIVDAGMRQLWHTGWMHNRVRMIVASFLSKHLLINWQSGEDWFWDTLVDADPASNSASWQWVAGSGADAAPYFRIFNPISQGEKFDQTKEYVRTWCPELSGLPDAYLYKPWEADPKILKQAGVDLGKSYPFPIVEHKFARQRALDAFASLKERREVA